jgi:putative membrane protein
MRKTLLHWFILALSVIAASIVSRALDLGFSVDLSSAESVAKFALGVIVLSLLNATLGRFLKFVTLPITCLTLGLFSLIINAIVLMVAASLKLGFSIEGAHGFLAAFVASIIISVVNGILGVFLPEDKDD